MAITGRQGQLTEELEGHGHTGQVVEEEGWTSEEGQTGDMDVLLERHEVHGGRWKSVVDDVVIITFYYIL